MNTNLDVAGTEKCQTRAEPLGEEQQNWRPVFG